MATSKQLGGFISDEQMSELENPKSNPKKGFISDDEMNSIIAQSEKEKGPSVALSAIRKGLQGASGGLSDEISGGVEAAGRIVGLKGAGGPMKDMSFESPTLDYTDLKNAYQGARDQERKDLVKDTETNPGTSLFSEVGFGFLNPANKLVKGASIAKQGLALGGLYGFGTSEADNVADTLLDTGKGAAIGGAIGKSVGVLSDKIGSKLSSAGQNVAEKIQPAKAKLNKEEILAAADRLGIKVTPGMLDDTGFVERLEYTLANSPSLFGRSVNNSQRQVTEGLQNAVGKATQEATPLSANQVGQRVQSGIVQKVSERLDPISSVFDEVAQSTKFIPISKKSKDAVIRNIQNTKEYRLTGGGKAQEFVDMIGRAQNADDVKTITSLLNEELRSESTRGLDKAVLGSIKQKLGNLENNSIMRSAIAQAREGGMKTSTGQKIGSEIVGDLKAARQGYRELMSDLGEVGLDAKIKTNYGPKKFLSDIEKLTAEKVQQRFFNEDNLRQLQNLQSKFPEQFELLRQGSLKNILDASVNNTAQGQGQLSAQRFLNEVRKLGPEVKELIFKGNKELLNDIDVITKTIPRDFNPSKTANQMGWSEAAYQNVKDIPNYLLYKSASTNLGKKVVGGLQDVNMDAARDVTAQGIKSLSNPTTRLASDFSKGPEKWANVGSLRLAESGIDQQTIEKLKQSKKGRDLLFRASDLPSNSKAMKNLIGEIQREGEM